jgi:hypothetical protein
MKKSGCAGPGGVGTGDGMGGRLGGLAAGYRR